MDEQQQQQQPPPIPQQTPALAQVSDGLLREGMASAEGVTVAQLLAFIERRLGWPEGAARLFKGEIKERLVRMDGEQQPPAPPPQPQPPSKHAGAAAARRKVKRRQEEEDEELEKDEYVPDGFLVPDDEVEEEEGSDSDGSSSSSSSASSRGGGRRGRLKAGDEDQISDTEIEDLRDDYDRAQATNNSKKAKLALQKATAVASEASSALAAASAAATTTTTTALSSRVPRRIVDDDEVEEGGEGADADNVGGEGNADNKKKKKIGGGGGLAEFDEEEEEEEGGGGDALLSGTGVGASKAQQFDVEGEDEDDNDYGDDDDDDGMAARKSRDDDDDDMYGSDTSSNIFDEFTEEQGVVHEFMENWSENEIRKFFRRERRKKRKEAQDRMKNRNLLQIDQLDPDKQQQYVDLFDLEDFDMFLPDATEDAGEENDLERARSLLARSAAPDELRRRYRTEADDVIRAADVPERTQLLRGKVQFTVRVDNDEHMKLQSHWVATKTGLSESKVFEALRLFQADGREVTFVHVYRADDVGNLSLKDLWKVHDAGVEFQKVFGQLLVVLHFIRTHVPASAVFEDTSDDVGAFWNEPSADDLPHLFRLDASRAPGEEEEAGEAPSRSAREGWLRDLYRQRLHLTPALVNDYLHFLRSKFLFHGDERAAREAKKSKSKRQGKLSAYASQSASQVSFSSLSQGDGADDQAAGGDVDMLMEDDGDDDEATHSKRIEEKTKTQAIQAVLGAVGSPTAVGFALERAVRERSLLASGASSASLLRNRWSSLDPASSSMGAGAATTTMTTTTTTTTGGMSSSDIVTPAQVQLDASIVPNALDIAKSACGNLLAREPHIRKLVRQVFVSELRLSTTLTPRGNKIVLDTNHKYYRVSGLNTMPLRVYMDALDRVDGDLEQIEMCDAEGANKTQSDEFRFFVEHAEQPLLLEAAHQEGVVELRTNAADLIDSFLNDLKAQWSGNKSVDAAWSEVRNEILEKARDRLARWAEQEMLNELWTRARTSLTQRCMYRLTQRLSVGPFTVRGFVPGVDARRGESAESLEAKPKFPADVPPERMVYASIVIGDANWFVAVDGFGNVLFRQRFEVAGRAEALKKELSAMVRASQPHVIAVGPSDRARQILRVLEDVAHDSYERYYRNRANNLARNQHVDETTTYWCGWFHAVLVRDDFASAFAGSAAGKTVFPKDPIAVRQGVSLARYLQDPLSQYAVLFSDPTVTNAMDATQNQLLGLSVHPLQSFLANDALLDAYERSFLNMVAFYGMDLNACAEQPHRTCMVRFLPGLGFRKAEALVSSIKQLGRRLKHRGELRKFLGENVYESCVAFVTTGVWSEEDDDDDDEDEDEGGVAGLGADDDDDDADEGGGRVAGLGDDDEDEDEDDDERASPGKRKEAKRAGTTRTKRQALRVKIPPRSCLDFSRIHPQDYAVATSLCERFCRAHTRGESGEKANVLVMATMKETMANRPVPWLAERALERSRMFFRDVSVHLHADRVDDEKLSLHDSFGEIGRDACAQAVFQEHAILFCIEELRFPFFDRRQPFRSPSPREQFALLAGGDQVAKEGSEVVFIADRVVEIFGSRLNATVRGRTVSGVQVTMDLPQDVVDESADPERYMYLNQLISEARQFLDPNRVAQVNQYLYDSFQIAPQAMVTGTVRSVEYRTFTLFVSTATNKATSLLQGMFGSAPSQYFIPPVLHAHRPVVRKARAEFIPRTFTHPSFHNWTRKQAEEFLLEKNAGEVVFFPSAKGPSFLNLAWKVVAGLPLRVDFVEVEERMQNGEAKPATDASLGQKLVIRGSVNREFDDLDHIAAMYVEPMARFAGDIQRFRKFRAGTLEEVEGLVRDEILQHAQAPYYICMHATEQRVFYLVYQVHQSSGGSPNRLRIVVKPEGMFFANRFFHSCEQLVDYFKRNLSTIKKEMANSQAMAAAAAAAGARNNNMRLQQQSRTSRFGDAPYAQQQQQQQQQQQPLPQQAYWRPQQQPQQAAPAYGYTANTYNNNSYGYGVIPGAGAGAGAGGGDANPPHHHQQQPGRNTILYE